MALVPPGNPGAEPTQDVKITRTIADIKMPKGEDAGRWQRWIAYLQKARAERPAIKTYNGVSSQDVFDQQLNRGEFDTVPMNFL